MEGKCIHGRFVTGYGLFAFRVVVKCVSPSAFALPEMVWKRLLSRAHSLLQVLKFWVVHALPLLALMLSRFCLGLCAVAQRTLGGSMLEQVAVAREGRPGGGHHANRRQGWLQVVVAFHFPASVQSSKVSQRDPHELRPPPGNPGRAGALFGGSKQWGHLESGGGGASSLLWGRKSSGW